MLNAGLINLITAREFMGDKVTEAFLASKPGMIGAVGFRKIAEAYSDVSKERDQLKSRVAELTKAKTVADDSRNELEQRVNTARKTISGHLQSLESILKERRIRPERLRPHLNGLKDACRTLHKSDS